MPHSARPEATLGPEGMAADHVLGERSDDEHATGTAKQSAAFALSQMPNNTGVSDLLPIARTHKDPGVARDAIFWLGPSGDPRALDLLRGDAEALSRAAGGGMTLSSG